MIPRRWTALRSACPVPETACLLQWFGDKRNRHRGVLPDAALIDYESALAIYRSLHARAR